MPIIDQPDSPELFDHQNSFIGGAFSQKEPHLLSPMHAAYLLNVDIGTEGVLRKAGGVSPRGPANVNLSGKKAYGLINHTVDRQLDRAVLGRWGNELYSLQDLIGDPAVQPGDPPYWWIRRDSGVSFVSSYYMGVQVFDSGTVAGLQNRTFMTACVSQSSTGASYSRIAVLNQDLTNGGMVSDNILPRCLAPFQRRLWSMDDTTLYWSKVDIGDAFVVGSINTGSLFIDRSMQDSNVAIMPMREPTPRMLIFRRKSIWLLDIFWTNEGYMPTVSVTLDFTKTAQLRPIVQDVGCVATRAITWVPGGGERGDYLFLSQEGIQSLQRSLADTQAGAALPLSWRIQPFIDRINWPFADTSSAIFRKGIAYFAVPIDGATDPNAVIAYDVRADHFFFKDWNVAGWARERFGARDESFYFQSSLSGNQSYTNPPLNINHHHVYDTSTGISAPFSQAVQMDIESRGLVFDTSDPIGSGLRSKKRWNYLDIGLRATTTHASLALSYRLNGSSAWSGLGAISVLSTDVGVVRKRMSLRRIPPAYGIQFRIQDTLTFGRPEVTHFQVSAYPLNPLMS